MGPSPAKKEGPDREKWVMIVDSHFYCKLARTLSVEFNLRKIVYFFGIAARL